MKILISAGLLLLSLYSCSSGSQNKARTSGETDDDSAYKMPETIVPVSDTAMVKVVAARKLNFREAICSKWVFTRIETSQSEDPEWDENNTRQFPELIFFNDSQVVENPRNNMRIGKWEATGQGGQILLTLKFKKAERILVVKSITNTDLWIKEKSGKGDSITIHYLSDAIVHSKKLYDPFHPSNLQWMVKPVKAETDSQVYQRTRSCVKFYALYYRDNLKKHKNVISFVGLPDIFQWYSGGIGLPEKKLTEDSWRNCFFNKAQSEKGYDILRKLIVDNEFNWDKKAPNWMYQTHSVLEQMYLKMGERSK